jgi:hypothetical protein
MSTWEMFKFWLIKETMPLFIALGIFGVIILVILGLAAVECLIQGFRNWRKKG